MTFDASQAGETPATEIVSDRPPTTTRLAPAVWRFGRRTLPSAVTAAVFVATLLVALGQGDKPFFGDAIAYWNMMAEFHAGGRSFSLLNFSNEFRGYGLPLLLYGLWLVNDHTVDLSVFDFVKVVNVAVFVLIGMVLAPALAHLALPDQRWGLVRRVVLTGLLLVFWAGYLAFPLSDLPALAVAIGALVAVSRVPRLWAAPLAGALTALAINFRPAYLMLAPIVVVLAALEWRGGERSGTRASRIRWASAMALMLIGFALVSLPQSLSAHRWNGTWSFVPGASQHLGNFQLTAGLKVQRYETLADPQQAGGLTYYYEPGEDVLWTVDGYEVKGIGQYLGLMAQHPVTFAGLYVSHLVNGFDQRYTTPYPERLATGSDGLAIRIGGLALAFLALVRLGWPAARRRLAPVRWRWPVALALCCVTSIPSAMETRFLLPLWVLSFMLVLGGSWPNPLGSTHRLPTRLALTGCAVAYGVVVWLVVTNASAHLDLSGAT